MAKSQESIDVLEAIVLLLQNLLAIELWRGGLSQKEIAKRLCVAKASINKMLKGVKREILTGANGRE